LLAWWRHLANPVTDGPAGYMAYDQMNGCHRSMIHHNVFPGLASSSQTTSGEKKIKEKGVGKMTCAPSTEKNKMSE